MINLTNQGELSELLSRHGIILSKGLGQNFLINPSVCPRMAEEAIPGEGWGVLEIGPGAGVLTQQLCLRAEKVVAVELDSRLPPVLAESLAGFENFELISGDALKMDLEGVIREKFQGLSVAVCANLPYYITSPLIMKVLSELPGVKKAVFMVQLEAAQRICAPEGSRESGAITVAVRYYSEPELLFRVSRGSFLPPPNVDSAVISLTRRETPPVSDEGLFFRIVRGGFSQRRKTLLNSLSSVLGVGKDRLLPVLEEAGLSPQIRPEAMKMEDFIRLTEKAAAQLGNL